MVDAPFLLMRLIRLSRGSMTWPGLARIQWPGKASVFPGKEGVQGELAQ
jgi:hypothetical protein